MKIGIEAPSAPIEIRIGVDHFTDVHIKKWAAGDLSDIDFATGEESLIIEYLSQIIIERVLSI